MKKSLLILFSAILIGIQPVMAKNVKVQSMSNFSTANPSQTLDLKIVDGFITKNGAVVRPNTIIIGDVCNVQQPKRLKRNGTFSYLPKEYIDPETGTHHPIDHLIVGKYSSLSDVSAAKIIETGAVVAGDKLIGAYVGPSVALVKGVVQNEEGNRAKSAAVAVYESTPLSYINKGKDLEIKEGQVFVMSFKLKDDDDDDDNDDNYNQND